MSEKKYFKLLATAIIIKEPYKKDVDPRYLITQRADHEETFPGMWTVPGGHFTSEDYDEMPNDVGNYWYNVLEKSLRREVKEEVNVELKNVWYLTSLTWATDKEFPSIVLSFIAEWAGSEVKIDEDTQDYKWVTFEESREYKLFDGILEELYMADRALRGEKDVQFQKIPQDKSKQDTKS